ncbi:biotin/lipoate A/B protein ligase family protein [Bacillus daqingensis]|uniref:Octanoyl-[GcvH]:protein N-octanoyltransferase n=1 Tax=Bacillus daqingensis TaxID=872396 RepID=A0ABV9NSZ6_9BACI
MTDTEMILTRPWQLVDESVTGLDLDPVHSFAMDDTLCEAAAKYANSGFVRTWVHDRTIVLGIQDSRLPSIEKGIAQLMDDGYHVIVRNSGGLAVVLDAGIYNISLVLSEERGLTIDRGYETMVALTRKLFPELGERIVDGEIPASYCPGRFDLSVDGRKFAGISQRRIRGGIAVQIYLAVSGSGSERAEVIRRFYDTAVRGGEVRYSYPSIRPEDMASLEELMQQPLTNQEVTDRIHNTLGNGRIPLFSWGAQEEERYRYHLERMKKRNERLSR